MNVETKRIVLKINLAILLSYLYVIKFIFVFSMTNELSIYSRDTFNQNITTNTIPL